MPGIYIIMVFGFHLLNFGLCKVLFQDAMEYSDAILLLFRKHNTPIFSLEKLDWYSRIYSWSYLGIISKLLRRSYSLSDTLPCSMKITQDFKCHSNFKLSTDAWRMACTYRCFLVSLARYRSCLLILSSCNFFVTMLSSVISLFLLPQF